MPNEREITSLSAGELHRAFMSGEIAAECIVDSFLARIGKYEPSLHAFLSLFDEEARAKARLLDQKRREGLPCGNLAGVPVALKDNVLVKGFKNTCASKILENFVAPYNSTVAERLQKEDAIILGKTNMDEFAMGSSGEHSAFGSAKNPWDLSCTPGGSSAGSAVAVSSDMCPIAFGSDTGGSVRLPGSFCGISAFKPTYGRVSRYGLVAFGSSLDQIGPLAYRVEDIEMAMKVIGVRCPHDSTSLREPPFQPVSFHERFGKGFTVGVPYALLQNLPKESREVLDNSIEILKSIGATIKDVDLSLLSHVISVYYIVATAELSTNLARFDGVRYGLRSKKAETLDDVYTLSREEGFGREVKRRIMLGTFVLSAGYQEAYYKKAQKVRARIREQFFQTFTGCDVIAMPVSTSTAFPFGSRKDPLSMYLEDLYTIGPNLAGLPALSVPAGFINNLPYGLQLIGPQRKDQDVLAIGKAFQEKNDSFKRRPEMRGI